jgi:hypothetical protein
MTKPIDTMELACARKFNRNGKMVPCPGWLHEVKSRAGSVIGYHCPVCQRDYGLDVVACRRDQGARR